MAAGGTLRLVNPRAAILVAGMVGLGLASRAQEPTLARQSPFGVASAAGEDPERSPAELELRGIMSTPEGIQYCIYNPGSKSGAWVSVDETGNAFVVRSGNPALDEVVVETGGRVVTLRMRGGKVIPATAEQTAPQQAATPHVAARRQPGDPRAPRESSSP
jgi:hypothetical protein